MLHMEVYPALPTEAASIRKEVFMEEHGFVEEFDEIDHQARHIVVFNGEVTYAGKRKISDFSRLNSFRNFCRQISKNLAISFVNDIEN